MLFYFCQNFLFSAWSSVIFSDDESDRTYLIFTAKKQMARIPKDSNLETAIDSNIKFKSTQNLQPKTPFVIKKQVEPKETDEKKRDIMGKQSLFYSLVVSFLLLINIVLFEC